MNITVNTKCYAQLLQHCQDLYPEEACGVLLGINEKSSTSSSTSITSSIAITNIHPNKKIAFQFDPQQWVNAVYSASRQGLEIVGIYHSHPTSEALPSDHDYQGFIGENTLYAILSLKQKDSPQIRIYHVLGQNQFINYPLVLT